MLTVEFVVKNKIKQNFDLKDIKKSIEEETRRAELRTINAVVKKCIDMLARDVSSLEGFKIGQVKKGFNVIRASYKDLQSIVSVKGKRLDYPGLRSVRRGGKTVGISFYSQAKTIRKILTDPMDYKGQKGSRPFFIKGENSGKKIAVFVAPAYLETKQRRKKGEPHPRKVVTMKGPSLSHVILKDWKERVRAYCLAEMKDEFKYQRKKIREEKQRLKTD